MDYQIIIILLGLSSLVYLYNRYKKGVKQEILVAFIISLIWVKFSGLYGYSNSNFILFGINLFPLISWTSGLVLLRELYEKYFKGKNGFVYATIVYVVVLMALEYIGYNYWGIQLATNYPGLFGFPLMHMPIWGQLYYLCIGPIYIKLIDKLRLG